VQDGCQCILVVGAAVGEEGDQDIDLGTGMPSLYLLHCIQPPNLNCGNRITPERQLSSTD
jgi:hypothetical protein